MYEISIDMVIGILSVRNHRYHPNKRLFEATRSLKHQAVLVHPGKMFMGAGNRGLKLTHVAKSLNIDVVIPRLGSSIKEYGLTIIRQFELLGIPVINNYESILLARNKFLTLQTLSRSDLPVLESTYASNWLNVKEALSTLGGPPVVVKLPQSRQGKGVYLIESIEKSRLLFKKVLNTGQGILIQRYIPPEKRKDVRVLVVGGKMIGAISLTPKKGDFRANVHLNARTEMVRVNKKTRALAVNATRALGLDISGVDMIEEKNGGMNIVEVNYTPGFRGFEKCTGIDVASEIITFAIKAGKQRI